MKKGVRKLAIKLLSLILVLGVVFCSYEIKSADLIDRFYDADWAPNNLDWALGRVVVSGTVSPPAGGTLYIRNFGGEFYNLNGVNTSVILLGSDLTISGSFSAGAEFHITTSLADLRTIYFKKDQSINSSKLSFSGKPHFNIRLDGNGHEFDLNSTSTIVFSPLYQGNITLRNMILKGLHSNTTPGLIDSWVIFKHDDDRLIFDNVKIDGPLHLNERDLQRVTGDFEFI